MYIDLVDPYQERNSALHRLDPRVKAVVTLVYVLAVGLTPQGAWVPFAAFLAFVLVASYFAKLGWSFTLRRSFVALPFMLAALAIPFVTPGPPMIELPVLGWTVTETGLVRFLSILLRAWLAVQTAILFTATTAFTDLLWALRSLRLPKVLVAMLGFMYRYLFVLLDEAQRMIRARAARSPRSPGSARPSIGWQARVTGSMVGSLFLRALERSERVFAAMASRGYDGEVRSLVRFRMVSVDWIMLLGGSMILVSILTLALVV
ncbi:MAG: cobalt ECF transporter T component CbiQ [Anaerolineales bacterium]